MKLGARRERLAPAWGSGGLGIGTDGTDRRRAAGGTGLRGIRADPGASHSAAGQSPGSRPNERGQRPKAFPSSGGPDAGSEPGDQQRPSANRSTTAGIGAAPNANHVR